MSLLLRIDAYTYSKLQKPTNHAGWKMLVYTEFTLSLCPSICILQPSSRLPSYLLRHLDIQLNNNDKRLHQIDWRRIFYVSILGIPYWATAEISLGAALQWSTRIVQEVMGNSIGEKYRELKTVTLHRSNVWTSWKMVTLIHNFPCNSRNNTSRMHLSLCIKTICTWQ